MSDSQPVIQNQVYSESRGNYIIIQEKKLYRFDFQSNNTLLENFEAVTVLRNEIMKAIETQTKKEEPKTEEVKAEIIV